MSNQELDEAAGRVIFFLQRCGHDNIEEGIGALLGSGYDKEIAKFKLAIAVAIQGYAVAIDLDNDDVQD